MKLEGNRVKIYDSKGNLVEEREASLEDIKNAILAELENNYVMEFTITIAGQTMTVKARLRKASS
jgi:hypothetical protein